MNFSIPGILFRNTMSTHLRLKVLQSFKQLHKARKSVFKDDTYALKESREKINEEYKKHKGLSDTVAIEDLVNKALEVEKVLKTCVIQAREVEPGRWRAVITEETAKLDNMPFKDCEIRK